MCAIVFDELQTACRGQAPELQVAVAAACYEVVRPTRDKAVLKKIKN